MVSTLKSDRFEHCLHDEEEGKDMLPQTDPPQTDPSQTDPHPVVDSRDKMKKNISVVRGIALVVGSVIGTGIFITPNSITRKVNAPATSIMVWLAGGIIAVVGGLVFSELGTMIPVSGSEVAYLRRIFGALPAFLSLWLIHFLLGAMGQTAVILAFSRYFWSMFYDNPEIEVNWWANKFVTLVVFYTIVAMVICKPTLILKSIIFFTTAKVIALIAIIVAGFVYLAKGHKENIAVGFEGTNTNAKEWGDAWNGVIFSYGGWSQICMVASEIRDPQRNLPIIVLSSVAIVTVIYLLTITSYHIVVPLSVLIKDIPVASEFGLMTMGEAGKVALAVGVVISSLGAKQCYFLTESRFIHAGAAEGLLPSCFELVSKRFRTPIISILYMAVVETGFILVGGIDVFISSSSFISFPFTTLCSAGLIVMRITHPTIHRPYRAPLICPVLFVVFGLFVFILPFLGDRWLISLVWVIVVMLGIPVYFLLLENVFKWRILKKWDDKLKDALAKLFNCD